jgi:hypothetical protein
MLAENRMPECPPNVAPAETLPPRAGPSVAAVIIVSGLFVWSACRIQTYVTAQDPFWYIALARQFLGLIESEGAYAMGIQFVSPGFPLLLALTIKFFGPFGPHWLNTCLGIGFLFALAHLAFRLIDFRWRAPVILLVTYLLIVAGYELNLHFLVYPFRGMAVYCFLFAGMATVEICTRRNLSPVSFVLPGTCFAAAVAIREPAVFGVAGALLYIAWEGGFRAPRTWSRVASLLAPAILCLGAFTIHSATQGRFVNNQFAAFSHYLVNTVGSDLPRAFATGIRTQAAYLVDEFTWAGIAALLLGLWTSRRNKAILCFFAVPAALLFVFYALYITHYRYVLGSILFLCPIVGIGILTLLSWTERSLASRFPRASKMPSIAVVVLLAIFSVEEMRELKPWGRHITRSDIARFLADLEDVIPEENACVTVPPVCRYLGDALLSFSGIELLDPARMPAAMVDGRPCYLLKPLNERSYYEGYSDAALDAGGVQHDAIVRFYVRAPSTVTDVGDRTLRFADGEFGVQKIGPWNQREVSEKIHVPAHRNMILWLDFGERKNAADVHAILRDAAGIEQYQWEPFRGRHYAGLALPARAAVTPHLTLHLESSKPMPPHPLAGWQIGDLAMKIPFDHNRSLSTHYWVVSPPFDLPQRQNRFAAILADEGILNIPVPHGGGFEALDILFVLSPAPISSRNEKIRYRFGNAEEVRDLDCSRPLSYHAIRVATTRSSKSMRIKLDRVAGNIASHRSTVRIVQINILAADWSDGQ